MSRSSYRALLGPLLLKSRNQWAPTTVISYSSRYLVLVACLSTLPIHSASADSGSQVGLTESQKLSGWELLFDGESTKGWRNYGQSGVSDGWAVEDGVLTCQGRGAGTLITEKKYDAFELLVDYRLTEGANSGVLFHVLETDGKPWHTGPEIQLIDSSKPQAQLSGWLYQLYQPSPPRWADQSRPIDAERPIGQWNQLYLRVSPEQSEVCLNGMLYYRFTKGNNQWDKKVADSKFAKFEDFGKAETGHIALQEHGSAVSFRNIKIRELGDNGEIQQPIHGKLALKGSLAFPELSWEDWEPIDESGKSRPLRLTELTTANDGTNRLFVATQAGRIYAFENRPDVKEAKLFLDITDQVAQWNERGRNEQGLLGLAFHPNYDENGLFFIYYSHAEDGRSVIARYEVSENDPSKADPDSETVLLEVEQPFRNHNGGSIEFGPDGYLYIGLGDGGDRNDPLSAGQDPTQLLGSILRIDVDGSHDGKAYGIPADNPFVTAADAKAGRRGEIFAYGVRNIWRLAFDSATGRLWVGDVGQELIEEVNVVRRGGNYGWSTREGTAPFGDHQSDAPSPTLEPLWEYDHQIGASITGGRVYRSDRLPELHGKYIYADYVSGKVWALGYDETTGEATRNEEIIGGGVPVLAFGEDEAGEVYYLTADIRGRCIHRFERDDE